MDSGEHPWVLRLESEDFILVSHLADPFFFFYILHPPLPCLFSVQWSRPIFLSSRLTCVSEQLAARPCFAWFSHLQHLQPLLCPPFTPQLSEVTPGVGMTRLSPHLLPPSSVVSSIANDFFSSLLSALPSCTSPPNLSLEIVTHDQFGKLGTSLSVFLLLFL